MPKHPANHRLTAAAQWPGLDNNPLRVCGWIGIGEAADLSLLSVHQPADTLFRWGPFDKRAVLVWHDATMAKSIG
jgi:hypothetical protein